MRWEELRLELLLGLHLELLSELLLEVLCLLTRNLDGRRDSLYT